MKDRYVSLALCMLILLSGVGVVSVSAQEINLSGKWNGTHSSEFLMDGHNQTETYAVNYTCSQVGQDVTGTYDMVVTWSSVGDYVGKRVSYHMDGPITPAGVFTFSGHLISTDMPERTSQTQSGTLTYSTAGKIDSLYYSGPNPGMNAHITIDLHRTAQEIDLSGKWNGTHSSEFLMDGHNQTETYAVNYTCSQVGQDVTGTYDMVVTWSSVGDYVGKRVSYHMDGPITPAGVFTFSGHLISTDMPERTSQTQSGTLTYSTARKIDSLYYSGPNPGMNAHITIDLHRIRSNQKPTASAGPNQTGNIGHLVTFDGSGSTDPDGDPLTYSWLLVSSPSGSTTMLVNSTSVQSSLLPDMHGMYIVQLIVHDGTDESDPYTIMLEVEADSPIVGIPGGAALPTDTNADGKYDDVNGNGRADFADVVLYFNQMTWIAGNEPVGLFDYNGNGRIDFADVVWLFNHL